MPFSFQNQKGNYELIGKAKESPYKKHFNDVFGVDEYYFDNSVKVTQKVKVTNPKTTKIKLEFEYQACKEACINDKKNFVFDIPAIEVKEDVVAANTALDTAKIVTDTVSAKTDEVKPVVSEEPAKAVETT